MKIDPHYKESQYQSTTKTKGGKSKVFFLEQIQFTTREINNIQTYFLGINMLLLPLQMIFWGAILQTYNSSSRLHQIVNIISNYINITNIILFSVQIILTCVIIIKKKYCNNQNSSNKKKQQLIMDVFQSLVEFLVHLSAFSCFINFDQNILPFIISSIFKLISVVYLQNYLIRRDYLYKSSFSNNIFLSIFTITAYLANIIAFNAGFDVYQISVILECIIFQLWYISFGFHLYLDQIMKTTVTILAGLILSTAFLTIEFFFYNITFDSYFIMQYATLSITCSFIFYFSDFQGIDDIIQKKGTRESIKQLDLAINQSKITQKNSNLSAAISGMINLHQNEECLNPSCFCRSSVIYDPIQKHNISRLENSKEKHLLIKYVIKCLYENLIKQEESQSESVIIDYCEFSLNYFKNYVQIFTTLLKLQGSNTNFIRMIKINKIKNIIEKQFQQLNRIINEPLQIEKVFETYQLFDEIELNTKSMLFANINVWKVMKEDSIQLKVMYHQINQIGKLQIKLDDNWKKLSSYLPYNCIWKYHYLFYKMYVTNEKLSQRQINEISNCISKIAEQFSIGISPKDMTKKDILFEDSSCYFKAKYQQSDIMITKTDQSFQKLLKYENISLNGISLSKIFNAELKSTHQTSVKQWLDKGHYMNYNQYIARETVCIDKLGNQIPIFKCYKIMVNIESWELEFVCMINPCFNISKHSQMSLRTKTYIYEQQLKKSKFEYQKCVLGDMQINFQVQSNIFLKQQSHESNQIVSELRYLKNIVKIFITILILSIVIMMIIKQNLFNSLVDDGNRILDYLIIYRAPFAMGVLYYQDLLQVRNISSLENKIDANRQIFRQVISKKSVLQLIFDQNINTKSNFYPIIPDSSLNVQSYDENQLLFIIDLCISSLNAGSINPQTKEFTTLRQLLIPSYQKMFSTINQNLHIAIENTLSLLVNVQIYFIIFSCLLCSTSIAVLVNVVKNYFKKNENVWSQISQFSEHDVNKIYEYSCCLFIFYERTISSFNRVSPEQMEFRQRKRMQQFNLDIIAKMDHNNNLNNKNKNITFQSHQNDLKAKIIAHIIISKIIVFLICLTISMFKINQYQNLQMLEGDGYNIYQFFPTTSINLYGCLERLYFDAHPQDSIYFPGKYNQHIQKMHNYGKNLYLTVPDTSSQFYQKRNRYFFDNPCQFNKLIPSALNSTIQQCQQLGGGILAKGMSSALRWSAIESTQCQQGQMDANQFDQFSQTIIMLAGYSYDIMKSWGVEFRSMIISTSDKNLPLIIIQMILIIIIHFSNNQLFVLKLIKDNYNIHRKIFMNMVPEFILVREKIIKQKFIKLGILQQNL